jgi:hypothetical protein
VTSGTPPSHSDPKGVLDGTDTITKSAYQPYGSSAAAASPFGFTGQRFDLEIGFSGCCTRHYSPA